MRFYLHICYGRPMEYGRPLYFFPVVSSIFLLLSSFFPGLISAVADWMSTILLHMVWRIYLFIINKPHYFYTWCGLSANLGCRSEMCSTRFTGNTGCKNYTKNRHPGTIAQICWAVSSQLRHVSTIGEKLINQQYLLRISS